MINDELKQKQIFKLIHHYRPGKFSLYGLIKKALRKLDWKALKRKTVVPLLGIIISW